MKLILLAVLICGVTISPKAQNQEKLIRTYLLGYEKKDWNMVASQFADGFTFTSPAHDDHITLWAYKAKCWGTSQFVKKVDFSKIIIQGDCAFAIYNITTTDKKVVRNTEYYTFSNGKIKSIECFFGTGPGYPGNTKEQ
ncbi:MAG: nuclear transport factor 2 family protein [Bacteroidetes bacterium]|nr:nuclear transport factor 2 family protein [Bacteroidota bacterium]